MEDQSRLPRMVELNRRVFFKIATAGSALQAPAAQQTPGAAPADPGSDAESKAIYVDMSHCQPASALSKTPHPRQWRLLDYETKTLKGSMIVAGENTDAPELRLPLGTSGWHRIGSLSRRARWATVNPVIKGTIRPPIPSRITTECLADKAR